MDLNETSILVTGGTGSFGRKSVARVLSENEAREVIINSRDERKQYEMQQQFGGDPAFSGEVPRR